MEMPRKKVPSDAPGPVIEVQEVPTVGLVIPLDACPPELQYLAEGRTVGLKVLGRLTPAGVEVEGIVLVR